jgi:hypothetical protein
VSVGKLVLEHMKSGHSRKAYMCTQARARACDHNHLSSLRKRRQGRINGWILITVELLREGASCHKEVIRQCVDVHSVGGLCVFNRAYQVKILLSIL